MGNETKNEINTRYETRITLLEKIVKEHEDDIKDLREWGKKMSIDIDQIIHLMNKIKNWIIGGVVVFAVQQVGLIDAIKLFLKMGG